MLRSKSKAGGDPTISVVLATWNGGRYVDRQLRSIVEQSRRVDQLIVCDDGSSDDTMSICRTYSGEFASFTGVRNESQLGPTQNFMSALRWAEGDVIVFCDQDDIWMEHKVARVAQAFTHPGTLAAYHSALLIDEEGEETGVKFPDLLDEHPAEVSALRAVYGMSLAFSSRLRHLFLGHYADLIRLTCGHDYWVYATATLFGDVAHLTEPLSYYRQHQTNYTGVPSPTTGVVGHGIRRTQYRLIADRMQALLDGLQRWTDDGALADLTVRDDVRRYYGFVRDTYVRKAELYDRTRDSNAASKMRAVYSLARSQAYRPASRTGLTYRSLLRDVLFAVTPAKLP